MRTIFLFLLAAVASPSVTDAQSMMRVRLTDRSPITISVDGRYFNRRGTSVTVGDLPYGNHTVKIFGTSRYRYRGNQSLEVIYTTRIRTYDGMMTEVEYDPYSQSTTVTEHDLQPEGNYGDDYSSRNRRQITDDVYDNGRPSTGTASSRVPVRPEDMAPLPPREQRPKVAAREDELPEGTSTPPPTPATNAAGSLTDTKMSKMKTKVNTKKTDSDKLNLLKDDLKNETVTTYQVSEIMDWFSFEESKVSFAKWAYEKTTDKEYYSDLAGKLDMAGSRDELKQFIQLKK